MQMNIRKFFRLFVTFFIIKSTPLYSCDNVHSDLSVLSNALTEQIIPVDHYAAKATYESDNITFFTPPLEFNISKDVIKIHQIKKNAANFDVSFSMHFSYIIKTENIAQPFQDINDQIFYFVFKCKMISYLHIINTTSNGALTSFQEFLPIIENWEFHEEYNKNCIMKFSSIVSAVYKEIGLTSFSEKRETIKSSKKMLRHWATKDKTFYHYTLVTPFLSHLNNEKTNKNVIEYSDLERMLDYANELGMDN